MEPSIETPEESMGKMEGIDQALEKANLLGKIIKKTIREIDDYDLERFLKKIDAECMDLLHNLVLAKRLAEGVCQRRKKTGKKKPGKKLSE